MSKVKIMSMVITARDGKLSISIGFISVVYNRWCVIQFKYKHEIMTKYWKHKYKTDNVFMPMEMNAMFSLHHWCLSTLCVLLLGTMSRLAMVPT